MKNVTRILAFILCLVMMLTVFAACGTTDTSDDKQDASSGNDSADNSADTADDADDADDAADSTELEPCTLVWIGAGWNQNDHAKTLIKMWNEKYPDI